MEQRISQAEFLGTNLCLAFPKASLRSALFHFDIAGNFQQKS